LARGTWQDERVAHLIRTLNEPDRQLRPQGYDRSASDLAGGGIATIEHFEILARRVEKALCFPVVDVKTPTGQSDQWRRAADEPFQSVAIRFQISLSRVSHIQQRIESHPLSPQQQTVFVMYKVNRWTHLSIAHDISRPEQA
jgi:hypothetical protein